MKFSDGHHGVAERQHQSLSSRQSTDHTAQHDVDHPRRITPLPGPSRSQSGYSEDTTAPLAECDL